MKKIVWIGCSISAGTGLDKTQPFSSAIDSEFLYINLLHRYIPEFKNLKTINLSIPGASNNDIFVRAVDALTSNDDIAYLFCAWTSMPRYNFNVGFELYDTSAGVSPYHTAKEHKLNSNKISQSYLQDICDRFKLLHHLQDEIVKLLNYINILKKLANKKTKIININVMCPWDKDFFNYKGKFFPDNLTEFTKNEILNVKNRDDIEIKKLYTKQHQQYAAVGGIDKKNWINLYNSLISNKIDVAFDYSHPGYKSNQLYFELIKNKLPNFL